MRKQPNTTEASTQSSATVGINMEVDRIEALPIADLRSLWRETFNRGPPKAFTRDLMVWSLTWHIQEKAYGGYDRDTLKVLKAYARGKPEDLATVRRLKSGTVLIREYQGERHTVTITPEGFVWREKTYASLSVIARTITGTFWTGPRFFGLRAEGTRLQRRKSAASIASDAGDGKTEPSTPSADLKKPSHD